MLLTGPIEISTTDIILALILLTLMALAVPVLAGVIAVVLYRRGIPEAERSRRQATIVFFRTAALALVVQILIGLLIGWIQELIG